MENCMRYSLDQIEGKAAKIVHLVRIREEALLELTGLLSGESEIRGHRPDRLIIDEFVDQPIPGPNDHLVFDVKTKKEKRSGGGELKETEPVVCKKCARVAAGGDGRGRHNKGCPRTAGPVVERTIEPPKEIPLEGIAADYRSRCCNERIIQRGGSEGTNHYECFKCCNSCDVYQPAPETNKPFDCDGCGAHFEADTTDTVKCPECKGSEVWPAKT